MKKLLGLIFKIILIILVIIIVYFTAVGYSMYRDALSKQSIDDKINEIMESEKYVKLDEIPDYYWQAVVAIEDKRFFDHGPIDMFATIKAIATDFVSKKFTTGGSTITQQLAKNLYFSQERKLERKIAELFVADKLEKMYSKEQILEIYINVIYYGDGYYGLYDASMGYFEKLPKDLTLYESTLLAGVPNAPSVYALSKNNSYIYVRQKEIVQCMVQQGYLSEEEAKYIYEENEQKGE
ncbi:MAG: transglycosylase domain-containing protein [Clostridia bacterium]|nr:transglycosylase domain-containing protein [Clostridia bacterium]